MSFEIRQSNSKLRKIAERVNKDKELQTLLVCSNITAIDRMGIHDHGKTHTFLVVNNALKILDILKKRNITPSIVENYALNKNIKQYDIDFNDAEVVVFLAGVLHDIGVSLHREHHSLSSVYLAGNIIDRILKGIYKEEEKTIIKAEVLHCLFSHHVEVKPLTLEAGIIRVADALDNASGRAKIPFSKGNLDSHSISSMSIKEIEVTPGKEKPINIRVLMSSSAGMFQVENLLKSKIAGTKLEKLVRIEVEIDKDADDVPERLVFE